VKSPSRRLSGASAQGQSRGNSMLRQNGPFRPTSACTWINSIGTREIRMIWKTNQTRRDRKCETRANYREKSKSCRRCAP
jgi:hypothetical protein